MFLYQQYKEYARVVDLDAITLLIAIVAVLVIDSHRIIMFMFQTAALIARRDLYISQVRILC